MSEQPPIRQLRQAYAQRPFSVFAVSRQTKLPGRAARYSTIHSAMIFPVSGRARIVLGEEELVCEEGTVLHGCPNMDLLFEALDGRPFEHINVYYEANRDNQGDEARWMERPWAYSPESFADLLARVEALEELNAAVTLDNRLNQIIGATNLLRGMFNPSPRGRADKRMAQARGYLEAHFCEPTSLEGLAARFGMSAQRFSNCFARAHQIRPMSLLISLRLERAVSLLQTGLPVKDVARSVGYDDPLYFSRLFKRHYGISPTQARIQQAE